jgi:dTDP-glucose pyrophosphorylase
MNMNRAVMEKAVILARGLGTRMRRESQSSLLQDSQRSLAAAGIKAMIPVGRPFLDYVLAALADAGYRRVCLVIGPEHGLIRTYYTQTVQPKRISVEFAVQQQPLGTADAIAAAESFAGNDPFLVINSDNYYPTVALRALRHLDSMGLAGFDQKSLLQTSNIPLERINQFAVIETDTKNHLRRIVEKPSAEDMAHLPQPLLISMNCWRFSPAIFTACRSIKPSSRGELEIPNAVAWHCLNSDEPFRVVTIHAGVLDLSYQTDIQFVAERLSKLHVEL